MLSSVNHLSSPNRLSRGSISGLRGSHWWSVQCYKAGSVLVYWEKLPTVVVEVQGFGCFSAFAHPIRQETLRLKDTFWWIILILIMGNQTANEVWSVLGCNHVLLGCYIPKFRRNMVPSFLTTWPWRWRYCIPSKLQERLARRQKRHIPDDMTLQQHVCGDLKSDTDFKHLD